LQSVGKSLPADFKSAGALKGESYQRISIPLELRKKQKMND
jgi:hypothetical protein